MAPLLTFVLSTVGAALGAWIVASLALSRFKQEQAFARRVEWYARMLEATHKVIWGFRKRVHALETGSSAAPNDALMLELIDEFTLARATAEVFAREYARDALEKATASINNIGRLSRAVEDAGAADRDRLSVHTSLEVLSNARKAVAEEAKAELYGGRRDRKRLNP